MKLIANYFDEAQLHIAVEALKHYGIASQHETVEGEVGPEIALLVAESEWERACEILERMEEIVEQKAAEKKTPRCPTCGTAGQPLKQEQGAWGQYWVFACPQCEKSFIAKK